MNPFVLPFPPLSQVGPLSLTPGFPLIANDGRQGYDPAIDLTTTKTRRTHLHRRSNDTEGDDKGEEGHIVREEQEIVDRIVRGEESGSYFMLMGSKARFFSSLTIFSPLLFKALT